MMIHVDPHIPEVPRFLVSFALHILAPFVYSQSLRVLAKAFRAPNGAVSEHQQRMAGRPQLYGRVRCGARRPPPPCTAGGAAG